MTRGKTTCYEFGTKIPFLVRHPDKALAGRRSEALISTVDILPTCAEAAGVAPPEPAAGRSVLPLLQGREEGWRDVLCTEWHTHGIGFTPQRAIRDARYKLILNLRPELPQPGRGVDGCPVARLAAEPKHAETGLRKALDALASPSPVELYDLSADPREFRNLAADPEMKEVLDRLSGRLRAWREATRDPLLDPTVFKALQDHHAAFARSLPERKRREPERKRFTIDMSAFRKDWPDVSDTYR
jgi:N-sulfoglucosamine sulfohydrolase